MQLHSLFLNAFFPVIVRDENRSKTRISRLADLGSFIAIRPDLASVRFGSRLCKNSIIQKIKKILPTRLQIVTPYFIF